MHRLLSHAIRAVSTVGKAQLRSGGLQQDAIEALCQNVDKPLVFPLSNPTDKAEITAEHAYEWSHGQAIFASGAPANPFLIYFHVTFLTLDSKSSLSIMAPHASLWMRDVSIAACKQAYTGLMAAACARSFKNPPSGVVAMCRLPVPAVHVRGPEADSGAGQQRAHVRCGPLLQTAQTAISSSGVYQSVHNSLLACLAYNH